METSVKIVREEMSYVADEKAPFKVTDGVHFYDINIMKSTRILEGEKKEETSARIQADNDLQTAIDNEESARELAINNLQNALVLKELLANKINEIVADSDLKFYNTANSVYEKFMQFATNLQNVSDLIPYISQARGNSTTDVMSQKAVSDALDAIEQAVSLLAGGEIEFPEIDLSGYATNEQVESAIFDVTEDLEQLDTTDKTSLVGVTNENHAKINNNINSIAGLQTDYSNASQSIVQVQNDLATEVTNRTTAINTINTTIGNIHTLLQGV